jgi:hypothetical protein
MVIINKDEVFYDCAKSFIIWETFWLCVWFFSMFASYFCTFCCKVCNLVQTLLETQWVQSHKKLPHTILQTQWTCVYPKTQWTYVYPNPILRNMLGNKVYIVASFPKFHSTCIHFHFVAIDPLNALAASSNKQTLISRSRWKCSLECIGGS